MEKSETIGQLAKALSAFQGEMQPVIKDEVNPFYKSRYAALASIWDGARELLAKHALAVSQLPGLDGDRIYLTTLLAHESGEWLASTLLLLPVKSDPQGIGSALTYARRYALCAILGIVAEEDDDAEAASGRGDAAGRQAGPARPEGRGLCPVHGVAFEQRKGTGPKGPYSFWACPVKVNGAYCKEKPPSQRMARAAKPNGQAVAGPSPTGSPADQAAPSIELDQTATAAAPAGADQAAPTTQPFPHLATRGELMARVHSHWLGKKLPSHVWKALGYSSGIECDMAPDEIWATLVELWGVPAKEGARV